MLSPSYIILRIQRLEGKKCKSGWDAHSEPPHQDLGCLQIQLFYSLVVKELSQRFRWYPHTGKIQVINWAMVKVSRYTPPPFYKGKQLLWLLVCFHGWYSFPKWGLPLKEFALQGKNLVQEEQILSFKSWTPLKREAKWEWQSIFP